MARVIQKEMTTTITMHSVNAYTTEVQNQSDLKIFNYYQGCRSSDNLDGRVVMLGV
jgi:hypothetical protein